MSKNTPKTKKAGKFASAEKQAASVIKALTRANSISSLGTARNYESALIQIAKFAKSNSLSLRDLTPENVNNYLQMRAEDVGQKALDMERQAAQCMLQNLTNQLATDQRLKIVKSEHEQILKSRSYTQDQAKEIMKFMREKNALTTEIAYSSGLRAHELLTLRKREERGPSNRPARTEKFSHRPGIIYTVKGKGGLVREVMIPTPLSERLEARRLAEPVKVTDRGIHYGQHYDIGGGQRWSAAFAQAAKKALGWSAGAHGLRHSYAQERMDELQKNGLTRADALEIVSQEMGHFRPEITEVYLR